MQAKRAYKTEIDPNNKEIAACRQHLGNARYAYNWGLGRRQEHYQATGKSLSAIDLHKELNRLKKTTLPWMYLASKCAPQEALRNLDKAFANFFRRCEMKKAGRWSGKLGYPQFKSKKKGLGSARLTGRIVVFEDAIQLPWLGRIRLKEHGYLPTGGVKILSATISERAGRWYVSIQVEQEMVVSVNSGAIVGVDLGIKNLATFSDGTVISNPRHLKTNLKKLKRLHRVVSRRHKSSMNRRKARVRLGRLYLKMANLRLDALHQLTTKLTKTKSVVVIEDLNVSGMLKNHRLAQAISDVGFGEFRRQLTYKAQWYGSRVVVADRWFASSKTCSECGWVDENLTLADRMFHCLACGLVMDRDLNAARNLAKLAGSSSDSLNACGEDVRPKSVATLVEARTRYV